MNAPFSVASFITPRFDRWRGLMTKILDKFGNYTTVDEVYKKCCGCQNLLFDNDKAFAVVSVVEQTHDRYLFILLAGGTPEGLDELEPVIHRFGKDIGASHAAFLGRKGMKKLMERRGWKADRVYMEKEIV